MLNFRTQQLLCLIHASELEEFVLAKDPRITYLPFGDSMLRAVVRGPIVTQVAGDRKLLYLIRPTAGESYGRLKQQWRIEVTDSDTVTVQSYGEDGVSLTSELSYTVTDGLSSILAVPGSSLQFRFQDGVGSAWQVDALTEPTLSLAGTLQTLETSLSGQVREALFGQPGIKPEPYKTFESLWDLHDVPAYRLGAVALALAYRTEEGA